MANVVMKASSVPVFEFYINNWKDGKFKHETNSDVDYCLNFPDDYIWCVGSDVLLSTSEVCDKDVNIYNLDTDEDFDIASQNMLMNVCTNRKTTPIVKEGSVARDVYVLHYRHYPQLYDMGHNKNTQDLFNVAIRCNEDSGINNWLTYCESDQKWYEFDRHIQNVKNEVIGWVKSPYKLDITELELAD
jgi:hypothetical protein